MWSGSRTRSGLLLCALVDVVVVLLAWHRARSVPTSLGEPTAPVARASAAIHGPLFLATSAGGAVLRVTRGSCDSRQPEAAQVWAAAGGPAGSVVPHRVNVTGLQEALGVYVSGTAMRIVGADRSCALHGWVSGDGGTTWKRAVVPSRVWYLDLDTTSPLVHGPVPGGATSLGCVPVSVATLGRGDSALVSCSGGVVALGVGAAPRTYAVEAPVAASISQGLVLALTQDAACPAHLVRLDGVGPPADVACLGRDAAPLGLAVSGRRVLAQVGERLLVSSDAGRSFASYGF